jgi:hypothetical protein
MGETPNIHRSAADRPSRVHGDAGQDGAGAIAARGARALVKEDRGLGEARRRKLAGTYPSHDDPIEKLRRFWSGRTSGGPVEDFRAPVGTIAITLDVEGAAPSSCVIDASQLVDVMDRLHDLVSGLDYYAGVRFIAREFLKAKQSGDDSAFEWLGIVTLWSALHHPKQGSDMRKAVSEALRSDGKAHITWCFSPTKGLAMALAERFIDLAGLATHAPDNTVWSYVKPPEGSVPRH